MSEAINPPLKYTNTPRDEVKMPLTTTRFTDEKYLIEPRNKKVKFPNKPQFLKMFKNEPDKHKKFMDSDDNRYLQQPDGSWYCSLKAGSNVYPRDGQTIKTTHGSSVKITGTYFLPLRATGIVYLKTYQQ